MESRFVLYFKRIKNTIVLTFSLGLLLSLNLNAQSSKAFFKAADQAILKGDNVSAFEYLKNGLNQERDNYVRKTQLAEIALEINAFDFAENILLTQLSNKSTTNKYQQHLLLGKVYEGKGEYEKAIEEYSKLFVPKNVDLKKKEEAKKRTDHCNWALTKVKDSLNVSLFHFDKSINSPYSDFGALLLSDTLVFSSFKFEAGENLNSPSGKTTKLLFKSPGSRAKPFPKKINDVNHIVANATFNEGRTKMYFTKCKFEDGLGIRCSIYSSTKDKRKRWGTPKRMNDIVNEKGATTTHPHLSMHPQTKQPILIFISDRKGGKGKEDIWFANLNEQGVATGVENLKYLNTTESEASPFFDLKNKEIYFSSTGRKGLGAYDIYSCKNPFTNPSEIKHLPYPINTSYNDLYYTINTDSTFALISSNRPGSFYLDKSNKTCCNDIFKINFNTEDDKVLVEKEEPDTTSFPLVVTAIEKPEEPAEKEQPAIITERYVPKSLEEFLPLTLYFDNDQPDPRTRKSSTEKDYSTTYLKYISKKEEYKINFSANSSENERGQNDQNLESFFEDEIRLGFDRLNLFSEMLLLKLEAGEQIEIFLKGYTSPRAKSDYNLFLGQRRVSCLRNHFSTYQNGIFSTYLNSGFLKISERSFGETTASQNISDDLEDRRNSVYSVPAAKERRVEIIEIIRN